MIFIKATPLFLRGYSRYSMQPCHSHFYEYKNEQQPDQTRTALPGLLTVLKVGPKRTTLFQGKLWIFVRYSEKRCEPLDWTAFDRINANTVIGVDNKSCHIQSFDKTKGQFNSMSNQGLHFEDVPINNDELVGKYLNTSHKDGVNYARIWYNGDEILPESTYTPQYMEKHKLGKYAKKPGCGEEEQKTSSGRCRQRFGQRFGRVAALDYMALQSSLVDCKKATLLNRIVLLICPVQWKQR